MQKFDSVLLVDDDSISIYLAKYFIEGINLTKNIYEARNGVEALEFLKNNSVDLILLDICMPVMDGFEFLERARMSKSCPNTSIILLTSSDDRQDIYKASLCNEVMGYIVKPLTKNKLEGVIFKKIKYDLSF